MIGVRKILERQRQHEVALFRLREILDFLPKNAPFDKIRQRVLLKRRGIMKIGEQPDHRFTRLLPNFTEQEKIAPQNGDDFVNHFGAGSQRRAEAYQHQQRGGRAFESLFQNERCFLEKSRQAFFLRCKSGVRNLDFAAIRCQIKI